MAQSVVLKINFYLKVIRSVSSNFIHARKLKKGNAWLFLCDTWSRYLEKLQFMHTETHQISFLASQDISKEILSALKFIELLKFFIYFSLITVRDGKYGRRIKVSDLVRKDVARFNDKFYYFECATLEMF